MPTTKARNSVGVSQELLKAVLKLTPSGKPRIEVLRELYAIGRKSYEKDKNLPCRSFGEGSSNRIKIDAEMFDECNMIGDIHQRSASFVFRQLCIIGLDTFNSTK